MFQSYVRLRDGLSWLVLAAAVGGIVYWGFLYSGGAQTIRVAVEASETWHRDFGEALERDIERATTHRVNVITTDGPDDSRARLLEGEAEVAVMRPGTAVMDNLAVVAPLWTEYVQVLVRADAGIDSVADLPGRNVAVGPQNSGNRLAARELLAYYGAPLEALERNETDVTALLDDPEMDAAVVTRAIRDADVRAALATGEIELLPLPTPEGFARNSRYFHADAVPAGVFPTGGLPVPTASLETASAEAVMMARPDLAGETVEAILAVMTAPSMQGAIPSLLAGNVRDSRAWSQLDPHTAAVNYFSAAAEGPFSAWLPEPVEEYGGVFVLLVLILALAGLQWLRQQRVSRETRTSGTRRELERLFQEVFRIEEAQREARDVRVLQQYLSELGQLKSKALNASLGTPLAESGLFLAFIQQARAVSQQIEWRLSVAPAKSDARRGAARELEAER